MRTNLIFSSLFLLLFAASCTRYVQVISLSSDQTVHNEDRELVYENDTLRIIYDFYSENGNILFRILNKSDLPLYVHWNQSSYIFGSSYLNYWQDRSVTNGYVYTQWFNWDDYFSNRGNYLFLVTKRDEAVTFLPPKAELGQVEFLVKPGNAYAPSELRRNISNRQLTASEYSKNKKISSYSFTKETSPIQFRNYLTFSTDPEGKNRFTLDHAFYAPTVVEAPLKSVFKLGEGVPFSELVNRKPLKSDTLLGPNTFVLRIPAERTAQQTPPLRQPVVPARSASEISQ